MTKLITTLLLSFLTIVSLAQCPKYGDATEPDKKQLNIYKNKAVFSATGKVPKELPLKNLLPSTKRKDKNLYMNGAYVFTEGILVSFAEEGPETCNCGKAKKSLKNGDVHMYIGLKANTAKKNCIVVEITPSYKKKHPDYANSLVKNARVRITGYLLYDFLHEGDAFTTCTSCGGIWRKTCWEIHPITKVELL